MSVRRTIPVLLVCSAVAVGVLIAADPRPPAPELVPPVPTPADPPARLVAHEWGTFTSFSGSDGVPVGFTPDNSNLPDFVYTQGPPATTNQGIPVFTKASRLAASGTVSMETPVVYFYTDRRTRTSVRVDFPRGWITEWYPAAASPPAATGPNPSAAGQSMRWEVDLVPGDLGRLPAGALDNHYYRARETDAVPLTVELPAPKNGPDPALRGAVSVQREKFLFYRGVGTFPPPVTVKALGGGKVSVKNAVGDTLAGVMLVTAKGGKIGFVQLGNLAPGAERTATLATADAPPTALAGALVGHLTAAGLYPAEATAMVRTWEAAWFGEDGTRVLYLVPRSKTDELLPLTVEPKPTEVVRVLVGRHDFLTPEQESDADRQVARARAARAELEAAERELTGIGRFTAQAQQMATKRLETRSAQR